MKFLETIAGAAVAFVSVFILLIGSMLAVGSMGRYIRARNM